MSLKDKVKNLEAAVRIGKNGLTEGIMNEIKRQLKDKKLIKVKMLKPFIADKDKKNAAKELAEKTGSEIVQIAGFTVTLCKKQ
ncbi:YhbY family RNA-binding protein [Candidatus Woesearchaeota archaeon]|nr:YhbY family RNA-binding protein [Candidatus Woesearchaeota archaeon]